MLNSETPLRLPALASAALLALALALPRPVPAQQLELSGQAGVLAPASELLSGSGVSGGGSSLGTGFPFSATAGVRFPSGFGVELSGLKAYDVSVDGNSLQTGEADFSALTGQATYALSLPGLRRLANPFFGVGIGVREVDFGTFTTDATELDASSDFAGVALAGLNIVPDERIGARVEIRSYLSSFEALGETNGQQDFAFLGGVTLRLP